jgi:hypothetical protein
MSSTKGEHQMINTTKKELNQTLDEIMDIAAGKEGPQLSLEYTADARYIYPKRIEMICECVGKLRSQIDHME